VPCKNGLGFVSLADVCEAYSIRCPKATEWKGEPMNGGRVGEAYEAGEHEVILEYCDEDTVITEALYLHITGNDTHSTFDRPDSIAAEIAEIEASELSESAKKISIYTLLDRAGLIPRVA
jgi:predicted PolB exonuclease-like 3'-5' exonuclease